MGSFQSLKIAVFSLCVFVLFLVFGATSSPAAVLSVIEDSLTTYSYYDLSDGGYWKDASVEVVYSFDPTPGGGLETGVAIFGFGSASGSMYTPWTYWATAGSDLAIAMSVDLALEGEEGEQAEVFVNYNHSLFSMIYNVAGAAGILWTNPVVSATASDLTLATVNGSQSGYAESFLQDKEETYIGFDMRTKFQADSGAFSAGLLTAGEKLTIFQQWEYETLASISIGGAASGTGFVSANVIYSLEPVVLPDYLDPPTDDYAPFPEAPVPEPSSLLLFGFSLLGKGLFRRKR